MEKIKLQISQLEKALQKLEEALSLNSKESIVRDGTIQRFEFTFELSWKLMKSVSNFQGIESNSPREAIKTASSLGLISNNPAWLDSLEYRNLVSHTYNEETAKKIYDHIPEFLALFQELLENAKTTILK